LALYSTIWVALALFTLAEAGKGRVSQHRAVPAWAWPAWLSGAGLCTVHIALAFAGRHGWSHEAAVRETARQTMSDLWRFNASMKCCGVNGSIPVVVPMRWNGDTPMIMMTDTSLPGVGTFTVRLFFYGDRYAGTWQHGAVGGRMSGRIEKQTRTDQ
jgi:hypothetical protein